MTPANDVAGPYDGRGNDNEWGARFADILTRIMAADIAVIPAEYDRAVQSLLSRRPGRLRPVGRRPVLDGPARGLPRRDVQDRARDRPRRPADAAARRAALVAHGKHSGWGRFGTPTGAEVYIMGISHAEFGPFGDGGRPAIRREWTLIDETAIWKQIILPRTEGHCHEGLSGPNSPTCPTTSSRSPRRSGRTAASRRCEHYYARESADALPLGARQRQRGGDRRDLGHAGGDARSGSSSAEDVIWSGDEDEGFLSSHRLVTMRHASRPRRVRRSRRGGASTIRAIADCAAKNDVIYDEWLIRDNSGIVKQLGMEPKSTSPATEIAPRGRAREGYAPVHPRRRRAGRLHRRAATTTNGASVWPTS